MNDWETEWLIKFLIIAPWVAILWAIISEHERRMRDIHRGSRDRDRDDRSDPGGGFGGGE